MSELPRVDIGLLVEEYGRTSYEVGYSDSQHYDPGAKYKDQERRESLQKLTAAIEELCTALTASERRVKELEGQINELCDREPK